MTDMDPQKSQLDIWHKEEEKAEKIYICAFTKADTVEVMKWFIRKDRLDRCLILQALFFQREKDASLQWNDMRSFLPNIVDAREMYHLVHWINRDALVFPCVLALNRCLELVNQYGITKNTVKEDLEKLIQKKFEVVSVFNHYSG